MTTFRLFALILIVILASTVMMLLAQHMSNPSWYLLFTIVFLAGGILFLRKPGS